MSNVSTIEQRARDLDEARKVRLVKSQDIDTEKYLKAHDVTHKVHEAAVWLEELQKDLISPPEKDMSTTMPWAKTHSTFQFRPGEVTLYAGSNGGGKSLVTGQVAMGLIKQKQKVCIASFEMKPKRTLYRMLRQFAGEDIDVPRYSDKSTYIGSLLGRFIKFSETGLWLYDQQGTTSSQQVIAMARYCAVELGVQHVFIDSLMKCVTGEDDYNAQKNFVDELTALARDHNVHIHLVHHIRKLGSEEIQPSKTDIKGSGAIADQVDNVLLMWRNKKKEHDIQNGHAPDHKKPDALLMCEKQRNGEAEEWYSLWFNRESQQFVDESGGMPMSFDDRGAF
jgi:twinkle protein